MSPLAVPRFLAVHLLVMLLFHQPHDFGLDAVQTPRGRVQDESRLLQHLMRNYDKEVRPVYNSSHKIVVNVGITLTQIFDLDEKNQVLTTNIWLDQDWKDELLSWNPKDFNGIESFKIPCDKIWLPDIVLYNSADDYTQEYFRSLAGVDYTGTVFWPPPTKFRSTCAIDVTYFPFDDQSCQLKLSSWMYDGTQVDLDGKEKEVDLKNYVKNGEWELKETKLIRQVDTYPNMVEPYPSMNIKIRIRRKTLYFMYNIVIPCMMMSSLTVLVFCLPPDSGEKIALGVTVILAFSVFMLAIAEKMPETSESIPLIGIYLTSVMALTTVSVIMTVMVLNFFYRGPHLTPVPDWAKRHILSAKERGKIALPGKQGRPKAGPSPNENMNWKKIVENMLTTHIIGVARRGSTRTSRNNGSIARSPLPTTGRSPSTRSALPTTTTSPPPPPHLHIPNNIHHNHDNNTDMDDSGAHDDHTEFIINNDDSRRSSHFSIPHLEVTEASFRETTSFTGMMGDTSSAGGGGLNGLGGLGGLVLDGQQHDELTRVIKNLLDKEERQSKDDLIRKEWRELALIVDRWLFWAFLVVTILSTFMFILVPYMARTLNS